MFFVLYKYVYLLFRCGDVIEYWMLFFFRGIVGDVMFLLGIFFWLGDCLF